MRKNEEAESILGKEAKAVINGAITKKEQTLLVCARKGLGTSTTCSDCGSVITCGKCNLPMVLYRTPKENIFTCNKCGETSATDIKCANCGGWRLKALGIATEKIESEVMRLYPGIPTFRVDGNSAKNYKQIQTILKAFETSPNGILIATEMVLGYLSGEIPNVIVVSVDTLFSIPDFRISENIFGFLTRLRLKASKTFIIQTRKPTEKVFEHIIRGDLLEFYRNEIKDRKKFEYPPFKTLIKITGEGSTHAITKEMDQLEKFLKSFNPKKFPAFLERINNKDRVNIILKIDPADWPPKGKQLESDNAEIPYSNLLEILHSLPKRFIIKVEPDNTL